MLDEIYSLCQTVFHCLMRLQAAHLKPDERTESVLTGWLAVLDYLAKGVIIGKEPDSKEFEQAFIL